MGLILCDSEKAVPSFDLMHHGTEGQQWGKRNGPPYPLNKKGKMSLRKQRRLQKKKEKEEAAAAKKRETEQKKKEKLDAEKERILRAGTAQEAMQFKGMWSNDELRRITDRLRLEADLSSYAAKEVKTGMDHIESVSKMVGRMTVVANQGINTYNTFAKVYNATSMFKSGGQNKELLPIVGEKAPKSSGGADILKQLVSLSNEKGHADDSLNMLLKAVLEEQEKGGKKKKNK